MRTNVHKKLTVYFNVVSDDDNELTAFELQKRMLTGNRRCQLLCFSFLLPVTIFKLRENFVIYTTSHLEYPLDAAENPETRVKSIYCVWTS